MPFDFEKLGPAGYLVVAVVMVVCSFGARAIVQMFKAAIGKQNGVPERMSPHAASVMMDKKIGLLEKRRNEIGQVRQAHFDDRFRTLHASIGRIQVGVDKLTDVVHQDALNRREFEGKVTMRIRDLSKSLGGRS